MESLVVRFLVCRGLVASQRKVLRDSLVDLHLDFILSAGVTELFVNVNHSDVGEDDEKACNEQLSDWMFLHLYSSVFCVMTFHQIEGLVSTNFRPALEGCTKSHSDVMAIKVACVSLVIDGDRRIRVDPHEILPLSIILQNLIVRLSISQDHVRLVNTVIN